jgi:GMP synthase (glutamine-hydrolysing)
MDTRKMKIYVVDNGGQWTHKEWRMLRDLGIETKIIPNTFSIKQLLKEKVDGLILSGGPGRVSFKDSNLGNCDAYIDILDVPILGICAGHQLIAKHFGGTVTSAKTPEFGKANLLTNGHKDAILESIPKQSTVWESHNDEVSIVPINFKTLASNENCKNQIMRHRTKPLYGFQFHPEVEHTEYGEQFFKNFIEICQDCSN